MKTVHDFEWGMEYLGLDFEDHKSYDAVLDYTERNLAQSDVFFTPPKLKEGEYKLEGDILTFPSSIVTKVPKNNLVKMQYYPVENKDVVIVVVPHWNASRETYHKICLMLQKIKFPCLRVTLPYHPSLDTERNMDNGRDNGEEESSTMMVSANIGLTIQAMQQSVRDIISSIDWLESQGFRKIGIMGSSIGSCCGFIAACHDRRVKGFFANLMSSNFGDVVWTGISTAHIRKSFDAYNRTCEKGSEVTQEMIEKVWMLNSPIAFVDKIRIYNPNLQQFIVSGRYDTTFLLKYTLEIIEAYKKHKIRFNNIILPCGHYSLGKYWFKYIDGLCIYKFFSSVLK
ncbi:MAG: hypothetical protein ACOYNC_19365 [Bacteroidales bacterium]